VNEYDPMKNADADRNRFEDDYEEDHDAYDRQAQVEADMQTIFKETYRKRLNHTLHDIGSGLSKESWLPGSFTKRQAD
jgi:hypothetical protein